MELNKYVFGVDEEEKFYKKISNNALKAIKKYGVVIYYKEDLDKSVPMEIQTQILVLIDRATQEMEQGNGKKK